MSEDWQLGERCKNEHSIEATADFLQNLSDKSKLSVDDVIAKINPPKDKSNPQLKDNARTVFRNALVCIQRFGGIVAQAASTVRARPIDCG